MFDMDNSNERPVAPTREWLHAELRRLDWAKGLGEGTLAAIASTAELVEFRAGDMVIEVESEISQIGGLLVTNRVAV